MRMRDPEQAGEWRVGGETGQSRMCLGDPESQSRLDMRLMPSPSCLWWLILGFRPRLSHSQGLDVSPGGGAGGGGNHGSYIHFFFFFFSVFIGCL